MGGEGTRKTDVSIMASSTHSTNAIDDDGELLVFLAAAVVTHKFITTSYFLFFNEPFIYEERVDKKRKREETSYKRNVSRKSDREVGRKSHLKLKKQRCGKTNLLHHFSLE